MKEACSAAFQYFDVDRSGYMNFQEMIEFMEELHPAIVRKELLKSSVKLKNEFIADKNKISVSIFTECVDHITMDLDALIKKERIPKELKKRSTMKLDLAIMPSRYKVAPEAE